jgi:hypothetical protein
VCEEVQSRYRPDRIGIQRILLGLLACLHARRRKELLDIAAVSGRSRTNRLPGYAEMLCGRYRVQDSGSVCRRQSRLQVHLSFNPLMRGVITGGCDKVTSERPRVRRVNRGRLLSA